ncbi:hypothetical protein G9A89_008216 [Geosiphon pyriformis]|nr:hypothetical protein G9A89_008216 [Geosiphon pyriformis]
MVARVVSLVIMADGILLLENWEICFTSLSSTGVDLSKSWSSMRLRSGQAVKKSLIVSGSSNSCEDQISKVVVIANGSVAGGLPDGKVV